MWFHVLLLPLSLASALPQGDVLVREKREPSRSYMFSGWLPGSGMSTFASTGDLYPRTPSRHPQEPWGVDSEEQPPPAPAASPGVIPESAWRHEDEPDKEEDGGIQVRGGEEEATRPPRKHKKKPKQSEDEEEYERPSRGRGSGGNAAASFNAWFPIMLGMYPPAGDMGGGGGGSSEGWRGQGGPGGSSSRGRDTHTVIANSVSHGAHGIASSHAQVNAGSDQPRTFTS